jgi:hypothetical protein
MNRASIEGQASSSESMEVGAMSACAKSIQGVLSRTFVDCIGACAQGFHQ